MNIFTSLGLIFVVLKLLGLILWPWGFVLLPFLPVTLVLAYIVWVVTNG